LIDKARTWEEGARQLARDIRALEEHSSLLARLGHWQELRALHMAAELLHRQIQSASTLRYVMAEAVATLTHPTLPSRLSLPTELSSPAPSLWLRFRRYGVDRLFLPFVLLLIFMMTLCLLPLQLAG
jgi:hypothetical protein